MEALKAHAVISRTQIAYRQRYWKPHGRIYQLCDGQHCQVYRGVKAESERSNEAVGQTRGMLLYYKDSPAQSLYHSTCGGMTQDTREITGWGGHAYLRGVLDGDSALLSAPKSPWEIRRWIKGFPPAYCRDPDYASFSEFRWARIVPYGDLQQRLDRRYRIGKLRSILPVRRSRSGNVNELLILGSKRRVTIRKEHLIRSYLGHLRSTLFLLEVHLDLEGHVAEYWIYGGGWGHAVGLCQTGAAALAGKHGRDFKEILSHYYPGAWVRRISY